MGQLKECKYTHQGSVLLKSVSLGLHPTGLLVPNCGPCVSGMDNPVPQAGLQPS